MRRLLAALVLPAVLLAACSRGVPTASPQRDVAPATEAAATAAAAAPQAAGEAAARAGQAPQAPPATGQAPPAPAATAPMLAYSYFVDIVAPADRARGLMLRHQTACQNAGPLQCQVVSAGESRSDQQQFTGNLQIRATPEWLRHFRDGLEADATNAGGHVTGSRTTSEDLTRSIVDTEAAVRARTILRDRLQTLVATHQGSLEDVLNAERALADVNTEIDQMQSELAVMRTRVNTSTLTLTYASQNVLATRGAFQPVSDAISASAHLLALSLAFLIGLVVVLAPWALVIAGLLWLFRRRLPKFGRKPTPPPPPAAL